MFDRYFNDVLKITPSFASFLGDRSRDGEVEISISPEFRNQHLSLLYKYRTLLDKYEPSTPEEDIDSLLLGYTLKTEFDSLEYQYHLLPISSFNNFITEFTFMDVTMYPKNTKQQLARHKCYMRYIEQAVTNMREGMRKGYVLPKIICYRVMEDIDAYLEKKSYLVNDKLKAFFEREYRPCIENFLHFMRYEYYQQCRDTIGIYDVPKGKKMYMNDLIQSNTLKMLPSEIFQLGKREVRRITMELKKLIPMIYPNDPRMDVLIFIHKMRDNPKYYLKDGKAIFEIFKKTQEQLRQTLVRDNFYDQVRPYEMRKVPKMMEMSAAGAFYYPGNAKRPGRFYINVRDPKENPLYAVETLTIHEGEPGHHYQFQYMLDKKLPLHRIFGVEGNSFAEGWALYVESLSESIDPITQFGRLTYEMFRAVRCVVDPGIHYYKWSYDKALRYMKRYLAMKESELESELYRYICIPGQATSYKVGEKFFLRMRNIYLKNNPHKTIKDYHQLILENGVLPLEVVEKIIES